LRSFDIQEALAHEGMMHHGKYYISPIFLRGKTIRKTRHTHTHTHTHTYVDCTEMVLDEIVKEL
jgi:hypothetical protein